MSRYPIFTCLIIIAAIFLSSCSIEGFTNDYNKLSKSEKSLVHKMTCFDSLRPGEVYRINPVMLKEELSRHPKSLVSLYNVDCRQVFLQGHGYASHHVVQRPDGGHGDLNIVVDGCVKQKP